MKVTDVAKGIIKYYNQKQIPITNLALQKLLYFFQKEYYIKNGVLAFDTPFYAFTYGPVIEEVWRNYKDNGSDNLYELDFNEKIDDISIIDKYTSMSAWDLVTLSHCESGWLNNRGGFYSLIANEELIKEWNNV